MQTLEQALENLVHNMEILRDTLNGFDRDWETFTTPDNVKFYNVTWCITFMTVSSSHV